MKRILTLIFVLFVWFIGKSARSWDKRKSQGCPYIGWCVGVHNACSEPDYRVGIAGLARIEARRFGGVSTIGMTYALKYLIKKERPDGSDKHSFPSMHTSVSFTGAAFIQRRYGWKWGIPAYAIASYVGWSRTYAKKHDWWDVVAGAALGAGSAYIFTRPFATKHNLSISPVASDKHFGIYASMTF